MDRTASDSYWVVGWRGPRRISNHCSGGQVKTMKTNSLVPATAALLGLLLLTGCATAPPLKGRADLLDFLTDGKTTREEVALKLGQPSGKFERENIVTYRLGFEPKNKG